MPAADLAHAFEDGVEVDPLRRLHQPAGQHRAAADEDGRDVQPHRGHQHAGDDLIAVGDEDQRVEGMGFGHDFHGVGNQLAAGQAVFHAGVVHGDAVADADGIELEGRTAGAVRPLP